MPLDLGTGVTIDVAGVALSQKYIVAVLLGIAICEDFSYISVYFSIYGDRLQMFKCLCFWRLVRIGVWRSLLGFMCEAFSGFVEITDVE